jgi:hypothetical protein
MPNAGMAIGRTSSGTSADDFDFSHPTIGGCFALSSFYNLASETLTFDHPFFSNNNTSGGTYELIQDGSNHWNWSSPYQTVSTPIDTFESFNENTFLTANFEGYGSGIWMSGAERHRYIGSYIAGAGEAVVLYSSDQTVSNTMLHADIHIETNSVNDCFFVTGPNATPTLNGFSYRDHASECQNSVLKTDTGVTGVTAADFSLDVAAFTNYNAAQVFGSPSLWTVSGHVSIPSSMNWSAPASWSGELCTSTCLYSGTLGSIAAGALSPSSVASPSISAGTLNASVLQNAGSVTAVTVGTPTTSPINSWTTGQLAGSLPVPAFSAATGGGASAALVNIVLAGAPTISGGAGCVVGDVLYINDPQSGGGLYGGGYATYTVTSIGTNGNVTGANFGQTANNAYLWAKPWSYQTALAILSSSCTTLPTFPTTGGYASVVWTLSNNGGSLKATIGVASGGAGYISPPVVGFSPTFASTSSNGGPVTASLGTPGITIGNALTGVDGGTWGSGGINGSVIGATSPEAGTFPTLNVATVQNTGSVTAVTVGTPTTSPIDNWGNGQLAGSLPAVVFSAAAGGGASAALTGLVLAGPPALSGGAGCSMNDTLLLIDPQSGGGVLGGGNGLYTINTVSGGAVATYTYSSTANNAYLWAKPWSSATALSKQSSTCTTLPTLPSSGGYINVVWALSNSGGGLKSTINVIAGGVGYTTAPTVGFSPTFQATSSNGGPVTASLASNLINLAGGVTMGIAGSSGSPVTHSGALIDATGVRYTLTTAGYTVPANCDLVRFTQSGTVSAATVTLPAALADGQPIQFVNYAGAVTALTFSPGVAGWTNGSPLAANTGVRVRWDATAAAWQREQ